MSDVSTPPVHDINEVISKATQAPKAAESGDTPEALTAFLKEKGLEGQAAPGAQAPLAAPAKEQKQADPTKEQAAAVEDDDEYESAVEILKGYGIKPGASKKFSREEAIKTASRVQKAIAKRESEIRAEFEKGASKTEGGTEPANTSGYDDDLKDIEAENGPKAAKLLKELLVEREQGKQALKARFQQDLTDARGRLEAEFSEFEDDDEFEKVREHLPAVCKQMAKANKPFTPGMLDEAVRRAAAAAGFKGIAPASVERAARLASHDNGNGHPPSSHVSTSEADLDRVEADAFASFASSGGKDESGINSFRALREKAGRR